MRERQVTWRRTAAHLHGKGWSATTREYLYGRWHWTIAGDAVGKTIVDDAPNEKTARAAVVRRLRKLGLVK
jgi:hypothetical protein